MGTQAVAQVPMHELVERFADAEVRLAKGGGRWIELARLGEHLGLVECAPGIESEARGECAERQRPEEILHRDNGIHS